MSFRTRYAPSPTGRLHLGNLYSALLCFQAAEETGGTCLLRIEDIDFHRCSTAHEEQIYADLHWLGCHWPSPVRRQSDHFADYAAALEELRAQDLVYPCFCSRKEIRAEIAAMSRAPHGAEGPLYPGTCRHLSPAVRNRRISAGYPHAWRLDTARAMAQVGALSFTDARHGTIAARPDEQLGDAVLARKDIATSYHLAVVVDDGLQEISHIIRGEDLLPATHLHILLQKLLKLPQPHYHHHRLIADPETGKRLAKRYEPESLDSYKARGLTPEEMRTLLLKLA